MRREGRRTNDWAELPGIAHGARDCGEHLVERERLQFLDFVLADIDGFQEQLGALHRRLGRVEAEL